MKLTLALKSIALLLICAEFGYSAVDTTSWLWTLTGNGNQVIIGHTEDGSSRIIYDLSINPSTVWTLQWKVYDSDTDYHTGVAQIIGPTSPDLPASLGQASNSYFHKNASGQWNFVSSDHTLDAEASAHFNGIELWRHSPDGHWHIVPYGPANSSLGRIGAYVENWTWDRFFALQPSFPTQPPMPACVVPQGGLGSSFFLNAATQPSGTEANAQVFYGNNGESFLARGIEAPGGSTRTAVDVNTSITPWPPNRSPITVTTVSTTIDYAPVNTTIGNAMQLLQQSTQPVQPAPDNMRLPMEQFIANYNSWREYDDGTYIPETGSNLLVFLSGWVRTQPDQITLPTPHCGRAVPTVGDGNGWIYIDFSALPSQGQSYIAFNSNNTAIAFGLSDGNTDYVGTAGAQLTSDPNAPVTWGTAAYSLLGYVAPSWQTVDFRSGMPVPQGVKAAYESICSSYITWNAQNHGSFSQFLSQGIGCPSGDALAKQAGHEGPLCDHCKPQDAHPDAAVTPNLSIIDTTLLAYRHDAVDFRQPSVAGGCASCGAAPAVSSELPQVEFGRVHRYRDIDWRTSFGPGVASSYDVSLNLHRVSGNTIVEFFEPSERAEVIMRWNGQKFTDQILGAIREVRLYTSSGTETSDVTQAITAAAVRHEGQRYEFDIYPVDAGTFYRARLTAVKDRNANAVRVSYVYPISTSLATLGNDVSLLDEMSSITDDLGQSITIGGYACVDGRWSITQASVPNGTTLQYRYGLDPLVGLNEVAFPDGTRSSFTTRTDTATSLQFVRIDDAAAQGTHRRKTIGLSLSTWLPTGQIQPSNRIRRVWNGAGELAYYNWTQSLFTADANGANHYTYIYEGGGLTGGKLTRYDTADGLPVQTQHALTWDLNQPVSTYTWQVEQKDTAGSFQRVSDQTDAAGRKQVFSRDSTTGSITGISAYHANGAFMWSESRTYGAFNQITHLIDRLGRQTDYTFDANGNQLTKTLAYGTSAPQLGTWVWTYNARGQVLSESDPNQTAINGTNLTEYDYAGGLRLRFLHKPKDDPTDATEVSAQYEYQYDQFGRLSATIDPVGRTVQYGYDTRNRVTQITYGDGSTETFAYGTGIAANLLVRSTDRDSNATVYAYDGAGRKIASTTTGPGGGTRVCSYIYLDGTDLIASETCNGQTTTYSYDTLLRRTQVQNAVNGGTLTTTTAYDGLLDRVASETDPYGRATWSRYDDNDNVTRVIRELVPAGVPVGSNLDTLARDASPNPNYTIEDRAYDNEGQQLTVTDGRGYVATNEYDARGRKTAHVDGYALGSTYPAEGARTELTYDASGNLLQTTRPRSFTRNTSTGVFTARPAAQQVVSVMTYTQRNLLASQTDGFGTPDAGTTLFAYSPTGRLASRSDPRNAAWLTVYRYGSCCDRLVEIEDPLHYLTELRYDPNGNLVSRTDANGNATTWTFDALGRTTSMTNGAGELTAVVYDDNLFDGVGIDAIFAAQLASAPSFGLQLGAAAAARINPMGEVTVSISDGLGRPIRAIDSADHLVTKLYDAVVATPQGSLVATTIVDELGHPTSAGHTVVLDLDGGGYVRRSTDQEGNASTASFDAAGNQLSMRDGGGAGWDAAAGSAGYDALNRSGTRADTGGTTTASQYDADGNVTTSIDGLLQSTTRTFDARDRKITETDRNHATTTWFYNADGSLAQLTDAEGKVTGYQYDARGLLVQEHFPDPTGGIVSYDYDAGRRLLHRQDQAAVVTAYGYDHADRLIDRGYGDGKDDVFGYDRAGRLTDAINMRYGPEVKRQYDLAGRLASETQIVGGQTSIVSYAYDPANRKSHVGYPGGDAVDLAYTARHQLQQVTFDGAEVAYRQYTTGKLLQSTRYLNGIATEQRTYFGDNQIATISTPNIESLAYTYNADKSLLTETEGAVTGLNQTFTYDNEQRPSTWSRSNGDGQSWTLTPVGDWSATTQDGVSETRTHSNVHETTSIIRAGVTTPLSYDVKGNLTVNQDGAHYAWDVENRLATATITDSIEGVSDVASYVFDALGRRVQKTAWGVTTTYLYDGAQVIREFDAPQQLSASAANDDGDGSGTPPGCGILSNALVRVNFQPALRAIPPGFVADKGKVDAARTNGYTYGWDVDRTADAVFRGVHPLPQYDTFVRMASNAAAPGTWTIALPNGTYPVVVVMGDAISRHQTNNVVIQGISETDPDPYDPNETQGYLLGDFDGYAELVTVSNGTLTIQVGDGAIDPKLCFIEIGHNGDPLDQATKDKLSAQVGSATQRTGGAPFPKPQLSPREYAYGSYVDEVVSYIAAGTRYAVTANRQYSPSALVDASGNVVERYTYDAYGKRTVLSAGGTTIGTDSTVAFERGYTGFAIDRETGLMSTKFRMYDARLGRWLGRDPGGYADSENLYAATFVPNGLDPMGLWNVAGHFYTTFIVARAAGLDAKRAFALAYWSQYPDEDPRFDAIKALTQNKQMAEDVQEQLHSLTGGNAEDRRKYLNCLIKNGTWSDSELGLLIHAFGDSYAHSHADDKGVDQLYKYPMGHFWAGHTPDFIGSDKTRYAAFVNDLFSVLSPMGDPSEANPLILQFHLQETAQFPDPGFFNEFPFDSIGLGGLSGTQGLWEAQQLRSRALLLGLDASYTPETDETLPANRPRLTNQDVQDFINKVKAGLKGCPCPK